MDSGLVQSIVIVALAAGGGAVAWGVVTQRLRHLEKRQDEIKRELDAHLYEGQDVRDRLTKIETTMETIMNGLGEFRADLKDIKHRLWEQSGKLHEHPR